LAEDDATNQQLAVQMLQHLGCRVDIASNGAEAAAMAAEHAYDAIFMDCMMAEMSGWEATHAIRHAEHGNRRVPIVAVTADVMPGQREKCLEAGMDDFVEKPIDFKALAQVLEQWASKGASDNQGRS
jgi:CheY-like chemotaxis protein